MSLLFAAAGGLIEAQDEALAGALSKAAEEPAGLQSLGVIRAGENEGFILEDACVMGGYGRVGPEDVSDSPLERIAQCAQALQPEQFSEIQQRAGAVSEALHSAATQLQADLSTVLGHGWQGEFAVSAQDSVRGLVRSAVALSGELEKVAEKAGRAHDGFHTTRTNVAEQAAQAQLAQLSGRELGPAGLSAAAASRAQQAAAEEQARAIVNTEYSPAVMDANLDDLDFTAAYRVVSTTALGGPEGIDMARVWNTEGIARPARPAAPHPAPLAALPTGAGEAGGPAGGAGGGGTTTNSPGAGRDAATEQALLASRTGAADGGGTATAGAGQAGAGQSVAGQAGAGHGAAGGGVNAATAPAGAPMTPMTGVNGQRGAAGAGAGGIRGIRGGANGDGRGRDRGFGSTSGLLGGGGAAATGVGVGASRVGGAGTLAGFGAGGAASPGGGGPAAGAPGAGPAPGGTASSGAGALSSSSTGTAQAGRAGAMPIGGMMGAANAGQNSDRRGHTPASYLTNATNTTAIIGDPVKVAPAVLGRPRAEEPAPTDDAAAPYRGRTLGRDYTGGGATRD
ncbi:hypothetical protein M3E10_07125 [Dietzia cinnamea]|uniref:WXG100 family type VII secretion target n=1 Tax=Dietzia cinnamea TaxID=321318 RepID=UPI0021A83080|nr:hypothetical protein [Dietzia cinnamea]MCT2109558.1 hypothetical protein [Dietzia cinnamea]